MNLLTLAAAAAVAAPHPGPLQTYKDWIVGCDNTRSCQANALMPDTAPDDYLMVSISRSGAPGDAATLDVPLPDKVATGARFAIRVDGKPIAMLAAGKDAFADIVLTRPMLDAMLQGDQLELVDASGARRGTASLAGFAATLLYIDDRQKRIGTSGALKAAGGKPDTSVPAVAPAPHVVSPATSAKPPRRITAAQAIKLIGEDAAVCDYAGRKVEPRSYRLDAAHTLVLVAHPCDNGAYNYFTSVFVMDETGSPREAQFDWAPGMGEQPPGPGTGELTNGDWDPKTRTLDSYEKGRGLGDCGATETYAWDGRRFRMIEQKVMGECRGSVDYIRVWTAQVQ